MTLTAGVSLQEAQKLKKYLQENNLFQKNYRYKKVNDTIWFAVTKEFSYPGIAFCEQDMPLTTKRPSWREACKELLTKEEYEQGRFSYDTVGTIAIIEIPDLLVSKEQELAQKLLELDEKIDTVLKKASGHVGELRQQKMTYLAGVNTKETIVSENGVRLYVNVEEVYYSIRLGTERNRIMKLVKENERILCMFSGVAPYPIVFAKNTPAKEITGVELNLKGHELGLRNIELNKVSNVELYCGDVNKIVPTLKGLFDRITMPLPHTGEEFLGLALNKLLAKGTIHYYTFIDKDDVAKEQQRIKELIKENNKELISITAILCGQHSPKRYRVCFDMLIK